MNLYMPFETALQLFAIAYLVSALLLLTASQVCLAAIWEEISD